MLYNGIDMDTFLLQLRKIIRSAVIKQTKQAKKYESKNTKLMGDAYVAAIETGDYWDSYITFERSVLVKAGIDRLLLTKCQQDKENIPPQYRDRVVQLQKNLIIGSFEEHNNYYRMLHGEPDMEDTDFVYVPENRFGIPTNVPVHELDPQLAHLVTTSGIADELIAKHPDKPYLKFLGGYAIPYHTARTARNYELLYVLPSDIEYISNDFVKFYNEARDYVMMGLYTQEDNKMFEYYDEFMGFLIMIIAIQRFIANIFKQGITREFYDDSLIRYLFEGYNMPYFEEIAVLYQRIIAKDLNLMLQVKSSNQVIYDISNIFNFIKVNVYKYYLVKDYKRDKNDNPVIKYKTIVDEEGNPKEVIDCENTWNVWFQRVNIRDMDPAAAIANPDNKVDYHAITDGDPYWINDSDLMEKICHNNFNSIITKYMSIDLIYSMTKTFYESTYTIRMCIDNQDEMNKLKMKLPRLSPDYVNLYELVIFLCTLVANKFGLRGEIPLKGYQIANVYGFNFKGDIPKIRDDLLYGKGACSKRIDPEILKFFTKIHTPTINDVDDVYRNINGLRKFIDERMRLTKDLETYECYKKLYDSLLITEDVKELYKKPNGQYASSYEDLLKDLRPDLWNIFNDIRGKRKDLDDLINYILHKLSSLDDEFQFISSLNEKTDLIKMVEKLVNEFKSYTVSDAFSDLVYVLDDPHFNMLKILDKLKGMEVNMTIEDRKALQYIYDDCISMITVTNKYDDKIKFTEEYRTWSWQLVKDFIHFTDRIHFIWKDVQLDDHFAMRFYDIINTSKDVDLKDSAGDKVEISDLLRFIKDKSFREKFPLSEVEVRNFIVDVIVHSKLDLFDHIQTEEKVAIYQKLTAYLMEWYVYSSVTYLKERFPLNMKNKHRLTNDDPADLSFKDFQELFDHHKIESYKAMTDSMLVKTFMPYFGSYYQFKDRRFLSDLRHVERINPKNNTIETSIENSVYPITETPLKSSLGTATKVTGTGKQLVSKDTIQFKHTIKKHYN